MIGKIGRGAGLNLVVFLKRHLWKFIAAYVLLLTVMAYLGHWTPEYLQGRDLWHFLFSRMVVAFVMLGVVASVVRLFPAAVMLGTALLLIGTVSAIKRESTGEPLQLSDLFLTGQAPALLGYVGIGSWIAGATIFPALYYSLRNLRFRLWSLPLATCCVALLCTYRLEPVVNWIHDNSYWIGVENLTFSQAESERMNGLATHLYFSTAGLRLKTYSKDEVQSAMQALDFDPAVPVRTAPKPDVFIVLGEAWWRDPTDAQSPIDKLVSAGFVEGTAISPVYGGTTPNAEFEVLTAVPVKSFMSGIIPYQHYLEYFTDQMRSLPRLLAGAGYTSHAYHNFERHYWLRDDVYPRLGFASFDSMETMAIIELDNGWPKDTGLYSSVSQRLDTATPQFHFLVTVQTHGPYAEDKTKDVIGGERHPGITDYHDRLSGAVDALIDFNTELTARGKPYVIFVFGDHLPGIRLHQWKMGWKAADDPRLHLVPFLTFSSSENAKTLRDRLDKRPLTCVSPVMLDWLRLGVDDRYMRHMAKTCDAGSAKGAIPPDAVIQHQLFETRQD